MEEYFATLTAELERAMSVAKEARAKGLDPEPFVEIIPAEDIAGRVEGIVGPKGIAARIRELEAEKPRDILAFDIVKEIIDRRAQYGIDDREKAIDQAVRTGVGILTEGVLVAPTEGISKIKIRQNPDGSEYLSVYYAGPIRAAGGTVAALSVVLADYARKQFGIADFRPTDSELERYVEEIYLYDAMAARLQYKPTEEEIKTIVRNCPVCIDGDPTEKKLEVAVHKGLERVETDKVRGGIALVIAEGIAQKASKVLKYTKKVGLNWGWLESLVKVGKKEGKVEIKPTDRFLDELVAGRPIFSYPGEKGGFRLRYGRTRMTGIAAKAIHPAAMVLLDEFPAIGTQLKMERPGKGCIVTPCDSIDGPIVKLRDGSVLQVNSIEEARKLEGQVAKILFLGDMLITFGDFYKSNHPLMPTGYCDEVWLKELEKAAKEKGGAAPKVDAKIISADDAIKLCANYGVPLAPRFTYFWHDISAQEAKDLAAWLAGGKLAYDWFRLKEFRIETAPAKVILESLGVPHRVDGKELVLEPDNAIALLSSLGMLANRKLSTERFDKAFAPDKPIMQLISEAAGFRLREKAPTYLGSRMGRPEKARERLMKPAPHLLFPIGNMGGKVRSIMKAYKISKEKQRFEGKSLEVEIVRLKCPKCGTVGVRYKCETCGSRTIPESVCKKCGRPTDRETCPMCKVQTQKFDSRGIDFVSLMDSAAARVKVMPDDVKGVIGLVSATKSPEPLEKGLLRAKHKVFVFRDGTIRFDATDAPLTHFYPKEIRVPVQRLRELGYATDADGKELSSEDQLCELKSQDMLLSERGAEYLLRVSKFVDDLLVYFYGLPPFYKAEKKEDLLGQAVITLSPHTSCGVLARIIGFTKAHVGYAHPYMISARRRNCDGDEDASMLLLDALMNFSKKFLPAARGGQMDASLVMTTVINPKEVDDEVHALDICTEYPLEFYEATWNLASPTEVKVERVADRLGLPEQYFGLRFSHSASSIDDAPVETRYVKFKSMPEKVAAQFELCGKIRAVKLADAAERLILSHFLPDLYGNLRSFSRQKLRCVDCNASYRRAPLSGKCNRCGGKLVLTISKGGVEKYLKISQGLVEKYGLPSYLSQRLMLLERDINAVFVDESSKQFSLEEFM